MEKARVRLVVSAAIVLLWLLAICSDTTTSALGSSTDQASLLAFRSYLTSDPLSHLARNWTSATSVCSWVGVSCGGATQLKTVVTALNLTGFGLRGSIAPHLGNLTSLTSLDLSNNNLTGILPDELLNLRRLSYLNVGFNMFIGEIPPWLGNMPKLQHLRLQNNNFTGSIPSSFGHILAIKTVVLRSNQLTGSIPPGIFNISSLQGIDLNYNSLSGNLPLLMCDNRSSALSGLYLSGNQFSGPIPSTLNRCRNLVELSMSVNHLTGGIPKEIADLAMLKVLYLSNNALGGELPVELGSLNLEVLSLQGCNLSGPIPFAVFNMSSLVMLDLAGNRFSGQLPSSLGNKLPNLQSIYLDQNSLSGVIPSSLANASVLREIGMTLNSFHGPIPTTLGNLRLLQNLHLGGNNLTGDSPNGDLTFLTSLTNCRYLEKLELSLNQFNGILPPSIGNFSGSLQIFNAFGSKIKGGIPGGIANLSGLHGLYLDNNELTGQIPTALGNMKQLDRIYLEHNRLEGQIPVSLCKLSNLWDLYLSDNMFYGPIPTCLAEIKSLRRVYLDSNRFNSTIPMNFWSLYDLVGLNLSSNLLTGSLPEEVKNLGVITELGLSWNQLSGDIPSSISTSRSLVYLSLAHNNFQGNIPQSLRNLLSLEFLDLSYNNLSGIIPKSLEELKFLQYLNVSFNRLEGQIPTGGRFSNFTAQSFLHNDALCGAAPLQVPRCNTRTGTDSRTKTLTSSLKYILPSLGFAILLLTLFVFLKRRKSDNSMQLRDPAPLPVTWKDISYQELLRATDAFSEANLLGTGGFGSVYKGTFSDGKNVAVKVFHLQFEGGIKSFLAECEVLRNIRHRNLVRIISCCSNPDFKALVLEYMPNGSLERWLYSHNNFLDMEQRLSIAIDVAEALEYIHHDQTTPIIHCDIKPSNVLLDEDMVAHVSDFGIAKLFTNGESSAQTNTLATIGYMAPEYGTGGIVSSSGDVYSYGIILLEMFTRKKPTDEMFGEALSLKDWVISNSLSGGDDAILDVVDINLLGEEDGNAFFAKKLCISAIFDLALDCLRDSPQERISMRRAVARLEKIKLMFHETSLASEDHI